jgi:hypothetical protein
MLCGALCAIKVQELRVNLYMSTQQTERPLQPRLGFAGHAIAPDVQKFRLGGHYGGHYGVRLGGCGNRNLTARSHSNSTLIGNHYYWCLLSTKIFWAEGLLWFHLSPIPRSLPEVCPSPFKPLSPALNFPAITQTLLPPKYHQPSS